jgi:hypothetical protein
MKARRHIHPAASWLTLGLDIVAATYGAYVARTWFRYGQPEPPKPDERDPLLDRFIPVYDVVERHHVRVNAPAAVTLAVARDRDLLESALVRIIVKSRELILGAARDDRRRPHGLLAEMQALGWGVLADVPDREVVVGAATRPWEANVTFRPLPPDQFATFAEPGYVKIAWTLRADPVSATESILRTETRVLATDPQARAMFRWYWAFFSPGIRLIRRASFAPVRREAERRALAKFETTKLEDTLS